MRGLNALLVTCSLFASPLCRAQGAQDAPPAQAEDALRKGTDAIQAGKFSDAERWFQSAVQLKPEDPAAHMELGVAELRLGKPKEASGHLRQPIVQSPQLAGANL